MMIRPTPIVVSLRGHRQREGGLRDHHVHGGLHLHDPRLGGLRQPDHVHAEVSHEVLLPWLFVTAQDICLQSARRVPAVLHGHVRPPHHLQLRRRPRLVLRAPAQRPGLQRLHEDRIGSVALAYHPFNLKKSHSFSHAFIQFYSFEPTLDLKVTCKEKEIIYQFGDGLRCEHFTYQCIIKFPWKEKLHTHLF